MLEQVKIKLTTKDESLKLVAEEVIKRCESETVLIEKVLNADKTLDDCWDYIKSEAKKKAIGGAVAISDSEVFGWAIHYFWEENLDWKKPKAKVTTSKTAKNKQIIAKPEQTKKPKGVVDGQLSLFDL